MGIVLICIIIIVSLLLVYFYNGNNKDKYGERLTDIKDVQITSSKQDKIIATVKEDDTISEANIDVFGKIVYINLTFVVDTSLEEAESKALLVLDNFSEEELALYDFQISLKEDSDNGFLISGAKNNGNAIIVWNNNNEDSEEV